MSRLARKPLTIPAGVTVTQEKNTWIFKGPKGEIKQAFPSIVEVQKTDAGISIALSDASSQRQKWPRAMIGTVAALVRNSLAGVSNGFEKRLELEGVGYKVQLEGKDLLLSLGFSHPVRMKAPENITFTVEKNAITIKGVDKALVGKTASEVRALKPPEPYKGKGIHYAGEVIRRKAGKKAVSSS